MINMVESWVKQDQTINHPFGNSLYHLFMMMRGVYDCFAHIIAGCEWIYMEYLQIYGNIPFPQTKTPPVYGHRYVRYVV